MVPVAYATHDFSTTNITDAAWVALSLLDQGGSSISVLPADVTMVSVAYSGGEVLLLGVGSSTADAIKQYAMGPNKDGEIKVIMNAGQKLFLRAGVTGITINSGLLVATFEHGRNQ